MPKMSTRSGPYHVGKSGQSGRSGPIAHGSTTDRGGHGAGKSKMHSKMHRNGHMRLRGRKSSY